MPGWWSGSTSEVKCVAAFVSPAGDARPALAVEPDHWPVDTGVQLAAQAVVQVEGFQVGQQRHGGERTQTPASDSCGAQQTALCSPDRTLVTGESTSWTSRAFGM
jgi:hypothetical protein